MAFSAPECCSVGRGTTSEKEELRYHAPGSRNGEQARVKDHEWVVPMSVGSLRQLWQMGQEVRVLWLQV